MEPRAGDMVLGTPHQANRPHPTPANASPRPFDLVIGFTPSVYQKAIFLWLAEGEGSCVVSAVPGSGKTTTLIKGANYIPKYVGSASAMRKAQSRFLAFNKHIAQQLEQKLPKTIKSSTIHSLGLSSIYRRYRGNIEINKRKYAQILSSYLSDRTKVDPLEWRRLLEVIKFTQLTLTDPNDSVALKQLCHHYGIRTSGEWDFIQRTVCDVLEHGIHIASSCISYEDMVWLPNVLNLPMGENDFLFVDEAQDLNKAQLELVLKAHSQGARGIYVGDQHQAIMGFSASDHRSLSNIIERTQAISLPLSICYRCPTSHIELANQIYPVIEPKPAAPPGTVSHIKIAEIPKWVRGGDLIICRCFYPLIRTYFDLLSAGIPALIRNRDISNQLVNLLEQVVGLDEKSYSSDAFRQVLTAWYEAQKAALIADGVEVMVIVGLHDRVQTLNAIYKGGKCSNTAELQEAISNLSKPTPNAVNLTTIHGAKGLEANRVFHLRPSLVPHPKAAKDWEKEQEKNLQFVALTRAKQELFFAQ
ncbi:MULTISPECIES: UvrD-helicase domain-containing protein [unclassified Coleofasciculus]|uniref:UvrD-helicase domain-containing protein n=1 Tax=unclassified Coleofasciculus TaxID=2692782 RepID=UPI0018810AC1|nr:MULTISPECIES: AAA family ATPase [unclassified Coleofasciculus]MBE9127471.1 ATP-dependent helicase [Coleofasciculus sp. LEGE 07081]MBE9150743.1 ATP-dependent helicase [Coleofasciculus sp. LEGE 07092]